MSDRIDTLQEAIVVGAGVTLLAAAMSTARHGLDTRRRRREIDSPVERLPGEFPEIFRRYQQSRLVDLFIEQTEKAGA